MSTQDQPMDEPVKIVHTDEEGNRLEFLGNVGDPTIFITVARTKDGEDDERVIEIDENLFAGLYGDLIIGLGIKDEDEDEDTPAISVSFKISWPYIGLLIALFIATYWATCGVPWVS